MMHDYFQTLEDILGKVMTVTFLPEPPRRTSHTHPAPHFQAGRCSSKDRYRQTQRRDEPRRRRMPAWHRWEQKGGARGCRMGKGSPPHQRKDNS